MNNIFGILFSGLVVQLLVLIVLRWALMHRLKTKEPGTWEALGRPLVLIPSDNFRVQMLFLKYLFRGDYRSANDQYLVRLAGWYRLLMGFYLIYFLCTVVTFIYFLRK